MNDNVLNVHLREIIDRQGTTGRETAKAVGIEPTALSKIATRKREPKVSLALRIARALDCSVEDIFELDEVA